MSRLRRSRKQNLAPLLAFGFAAGLLAACSSTSVTDMIPSAAGGLPANTPERSATPLEYPAAGAMPQRREALPLSDDELNRAKAELSTLRQQQEERAGALAKEETAPAKADAVPAKTAKKPKPKNAKAAAELTPAKDQTK